MTTLYKPVKIESAEQAEALPIGSILMITFTVNLDPTEFIEATAFKAGDVWWCDGKVIDVAELIGWTALVPIEAEECHSEDYGNYHLMEAIDGPKPFTAYLVDQEEA